MLRNDVKFNEEHLPPETLVGRHAVLFKWLRVLPFLQTSVISDVIRFSSAHHPASQEAFPYEHHDSTACNDADSCSTLRTRLRSIYLPHLSMPRRGPKCKLGYHRVFNHLAVPLHRDAVEVPAVPIDPMEKRPFTTQPSTKSLPNGATIDRSGRRFSPVCDIWRRATPRYERAAWRQDRYRRQKRGDRIGISGTNTKRARKSSDHRR